MLPSCSGPRAGVAPSNGPCANLLVCSRQPNVHPTYALIRWLVSPVQLRVHVHLRSKYGVRTAPKVHRVNGPLSKVVVTSVFKHQIAMRFNWHKLLVVCTRTSNCGRNSRCALATDWMHVSSLQGSLTTGTVTEVDTIYVCPAPFRYQAELQPHFPSTHFVVSWTPGRGSRFLGHLL